VISTGKPI